MKSRVHILLFILLSMITSTVLAEIDNRPLYTFYTASPRGTYFQFGNDLKKACTNLNIQVVATDGSLDNLNQLIQAPPIKTGYRFAFAQADVLLSVFGDDKVTHDLIKVVMPMYNEDITILVSVNSKIKSIEDLNGKRVAIGQVGSGVWFTANTIKDQLGLHWIPIERSPDESILTVLIGEVDAMFIVQGTPVKILDELGWPMKKFVRLLDMKNVPGYERSTLAAGTYQWQSEIVELRATKSLMVVAADVPQPAVNAITSCISNNLTELQKWGHPKWNSVKIKKK